MRIIVEIGHPAQVHLFKNLIWRLEERGHTIRVVTSNKEIAVDLIKGYGFDYDVMYDNKQGSFLHKLGMLANGEIEMLKAARKFKPNLFISATSEISGPISRILGKPHIGTSDTEYAELTNMISYPFADVILTPASFKKDLGQKHVRFRGCKELAYLHPNVFNPDPSVLKGLGLSEKDNIFLVRFSSFDAIHNMNSAKFDKKYVPTLIDRLKREGEIIITSEVALGQDMKKYQRSLSPLKYHDLLYYSKLYVGEGSTSANEAAVLGVPSLHFERVNKGGKVSDITRYIGVMDELQNSYGLVYSFHDEIMLLAKLDEILSDVEGSKREWKGKRARFLKDSIDLTAFMLWVVENYPASMEEVKRDPLLQMRFR